MSGVLFIRSLSSGWCLNWQLFGVRARKHCDVRHGNRAAAGSSRYHPAEGAGSGREVLFRKFSELDFWRYPGPLISFEGSLRVRCSSSELVREWEKF